MGALGSHELTELLVAWSDGDEGALERPAPLVHTELRRLASHYMRKEREDHLLQTSALINEAYVRLIDWKAVRRQNRAHFFGVAARMMRRILVDFGRQRVERGADARHISLGHALSMTDEKDSDLLALDGALEALAQIDERHGRGADRQRRHRAGRQAALLHGLRIGERHLAARLTVIAGCGFRIAD
ncbi:MAG TPA: ECF-type sigma factor [Pyrinomonadaceae bacterium]|jgi:RNA polymerase sigma factor (TIGR02999 family)